MSAVLDKTHPHPVLPPEGEGQSDKDISIDSWHYQAFSRMLAGINQTIEKICAKHFVHPNFIAGYLKWFEEAQPEEFGKWWAAWLRIGELEEEGRTDAEAQKMYNEQLRIYRDLSYRVVEKYIGWKKDRDAAARAAAEQPAQARLI